MVDATAIGRFVETGPELRVEVDVENDDAVAGQRLVPAELLTVFDDVILLVVAVVTQEVSTAFVGECGHVGNGGRSGEFLGCEPVHEPALVGGIATGVETAAVVVAIVHEVPVADKLLTTIVEVGESEAVAVFMAEGAEGAIAVVGGQFLYGTVAVDEPGAIAIGDIERIAVEMCHGVLVVAHPPLVGPDGIVASTKTAIAAAFAGIDDKQLVDVSVAIPVVEAPVDVTFEEGVDNIFDEELGILVVRYRTAILRKAVDNDVFEVEDRPELVVALGNEIVADGAEEGFLGEIFRIEYLVPLFERLHLIVLEGTVGKGSQHHQLVEVALVEVAPRLA